MSINLYNSTINNGLFNILGGAFMAQADVNASRGTTLPQDLVRLLTFFNTIGPNPTLEPSIQNVTNILPSYQSGGQSIQSVLQQFAQNFTIAMAAQDATQPDSSLKTALQYVITQMIAQGQTLNKSTVTCTVTPNPANGGNGVIVTSTKRGDGLVQENALSEKLAVTALSTSLTASLQFQGQAAASSPLGQDWPLGSGARTSVQAVDANSSSLLTNGGMETQATLANVPDGWTLSVGTPGTHCLMTVNAVQNIVVSGTPTTGGMVLNFIDQNGKKQSTSLIAPGATSTNVQAALNALTGLSKVTVGTATGSTPNFTYPVTFTGVGGNLQLLTVTNLFNTGSVAVNSVTAGTAQVFAGGAAVQLKSDGSTLQTLNQKLTGLSPSTAYAVSLWAACDFVPSAGVVTVDLVDGIAGTVLLDAQGVSNSITFNASGLLNGFQHLSKLQTGECFFRTPAILPTSVYIRVRISTAVTSGSSVFVDNVALTTPTQIYAGSPLVAGFAGNTPFTTADTWQLVVSNDRKGVLREFCERNFSTSGLGLLFPTASSPTIPDSTCTPYSGGLNFTLPANSQYIPLLA